MVQARAYYWLDAARGYKKRQDTLHRLLVEQPGTRSPDVAEMLSDVNEEIITFTSYPKGSLATDPVEQPTGAT